VLLIFFVGIGIWLALQWSMLDRKHRMAILLSLILGFGFRVGWTKCEGLFESKEIEGFPIEGWAEEDTTLTWIRLKTGAEQTEARKILMEAVRDSLKAKYSLYGWKNFYFINPDSVEYFFQMRLYDGTSANKGDTVYDRHFFVPDVRKWHWRRID